MFRLSRIHNINQTLHHTVTNYTKNINYTLQGRKEPASFHCTGQSGGIQNYKPHCVSMFWIRNRENGVENNMSGCLRLDACCRCMLLYWIFCVFMIISIGILWRSTGHIIKIGHSTTDGYILIELYKSPGRSTDTLLCTPLRMVEHSVSPSPRLVGITDIWVFLSLVSVMVAWNCH